jgi:hypothetical protein
MRQNPTLIAVTVVLLSLPAWCVLAIWIYAHGVLFWGWPMAIGPVQVMVYCTPGHTSCVTVASGWLTSILEWICLPTRYGFLYLSLMAAAMLIGFKSTLAQTWQRRSLWLLPVGAITIIGFLVVAERIGI